MYKTVAFVGYGRGGTFIDMCTTVPWPDISSEAFAASRELSGLNDRQLLIDMGFPEAVLLMDNIGKMRQRAQYVNLDEFVFNHDIPVTENEILLACNYRLNGQDNTYHHGRVEDDDYVF